MMMSIAPEQKFPTKSAFETIVNKHLEGLDNKPKRYGRSKGGIIDMEVYDKILTVLKSDILRGRGDDLMAMKKATSKMSLDEKFQHWVLDTFELSKATCISLVIKRNKKIVAVLEEMYNILVHYHAKSDHGGRDKTANAVLKEYAYIPRKIISSFVQACPTCKSKRRDLYASCFKININKFQTQTKTNVQADFTKGVCFSTCTVGGYFTFLDVLF